MKLPWIYRVLLALLPDEFRREYGPELLATLAEKERKASESGLREVVRTRARESAALARAALWTRRRSVRRTRPQSPKLTTLGADVRFALRSHRKQFPATAVIVATLALGIGANTAMFGFTDQVLLRPLPVRQPERLVFLSAPGPWSGWRRGTDTFSYPAYENLRDENDVFEGVFARYATSVTLDRNGEVERVRGVLVSGNYFQVLGVPAELGRVLVSDDDGPRGASAVAVLSHRYWQRRFGADPNLVGETIRLNGHPMTVLGIARRGFDGVEIGRAPDVFVPLTMKALMTPTWDHLDNRRSNFLHVFARLRDGVTLARAEGSANVLYRTVLERDLEVMPDPSERFEEEYRSKPLHLRAGLRGISELRERYPSLLVALHGMLALVLLIVCTNVAHLLVARGASRRREAATHLALGASRSALARRLLVEILVLAVAGGLLGLLLASWASEALVAALPIEGPAEVLAAGPNLHVLGFAFLLSIVTALLSGLAPAVLLCRTSLASTLKEESAAGAGGRARLGKALVIAQVALALVLMMGAGLFARSLANLRRVDVGFDTENLSSFSIHPALNGYGRDRTLSLVDELSRELRGLPGVTSVSAARSAAFTEDGWTQTIRVQGYEPGDGEDMNIGVDSVAPDYFRTLGIPLLRGRGVTEADLPDAPKVAVINERMARHFFGDEVPVGRLFRFGASSEGEYDIEIVGVVPDGKYRRVREEELRFAFIPMKQDAGLSEVTFYLRSDASGTSADDLRRSVRDVAADLPIYAVSTLTDRMEASIFLERAVAGLATAFASLSSFLAALGIYGVASYTLARRTREIGLRMALGAARRSVLKMILKEVWTLAGIGLLLGISAGLVLGRLLASELYELAPWDPLTLGGATALAGAVAVFSGYFPARRASRLDPVRALKWE